MIRIEALPDACADESHDEPIEYVILPWEQRKKHHQRCTTTAGTEIALALPRGTVMSHDMVLFSSPQRKIVVCASEEPVLVISPANPIEACKVSHHLGNWHRCLEVVDETTLLAEPDAPFKQWLEQHHIRYQQQNRRYQPNLRGDAH